MEMTQQEIKDLVENSGQTIGGIFQTTFAYIESNKGKEGLERFQNEMENLGYPVDFDQIETLKWYPTGLRALTFIALRRAFGWNDEDMVRFGEDSVSYSPLLKFFMKYFISMKKIFEQGSLHWKKHHTKGRLEGYEFSEKEKYAIIRIHDCKVHPDFCLFFKGYIKKLSQFSGKRIVGIKETKCMFREDPYHEYLVNWE
ncbi:MAG: hypothetical protein GF370_05030 [Candidatus Nealsonbacteria bacterium]|nr:hypothetical protein [Candidatus Nealsonbacteria bacterium]